MYVNPTSSSAFHVHSLIEAEFLKPLVNCQQEMLFPTKKIIAPMGLNLFFPANPDPDYAELINREISLYAERFQHRRLTKIWFRGVPLTGMKAGELTELAFHTNMLFSPEFGSTGEYGFECEPSDVNSDNLALMKGLRFNHILLSIDAQIPPEKQRISHLLDLIDEYRFQEKRYRLDVINADPDTLTCWLEVLMRHKPSMLEIQGLEEMDESVPLSSIASQLLNYQYHLLGDRFFVPSDHALIAMRNRGNLQYTPWGLCQRQLGDWLGVGIDALGKLGNGYYQNTDQVDRYKLLVSTGQLPVCFSGTYPEGQVKTRPWLLIDQLLCQHRIFVQPSKTGLTLSQPILGVVETSAAKGWLLQSTDCFELTDAGINHLPELCQQLQNC